MSFPEYRIEYTIQRRMTEDDDFEEIGFGSSGAWDSIVQAEHMLGSDLQNGCWETAHGMPEPSVELAAGRES